MHEPDDDLARRIADAAGELGGSSLARGASGAAARSVARHRRGVVAQTALATLVLVAGAGAGARLLTAPASAPAQLAGTDPASPAPSATPTPSPAAVAPSASSSPSPARPVPTASPSATRPPTASVTSPAPAPAKPPAPCPAAPRAVAAPAGVSVRLELSGSKVARGGTLRMTVVVRNDGTTPVAYTTGSRRYDFWVTNGGAERWLWSDGKAFTMELRHATLEPGQEVRETVTWSLTGCTGPGGTSGEPGAPLPPGTYSAFAWWQSDAERGEGWRSSPVQFEID